VARFRRDAKVAALKRSPLFSGLSRKQLDHIARLSDDLEVPAGTVLCQEGSRGREFFVIVEGKAKVTRANREIATVGSGDFFGEMALLAHANRTATVTATTPLRFFMVSDRAFRSVLDTDRAIEQKLLRTLAQRLLETTPS
jgi:CRP-like cAMP-binding protein